eukprot:scaffold88360_cov23-Prasinocladus_malaysianus.AAC.2
MEHHSSLEEAALMLKGQKQAADAYPSMESLYNPKHFEVEDDRHERLRACQMVDTPQEGRFDTIT